VTVLAPAGGAALPPNVVTQVTFTATDASGIAAINVLLSEDGGAHFKIVAKNVAPAGSVAWFVPNLPGTDNRIRVQAIDGAGNMGSGDSEGAFTILPVTTGRVPTTLRDMQLAGTQPFQGAILDDAQSCATCHGGYDAANEPWHNWQGSMMGQAARDPLFLACMAVAEQDAPSVGDLCIRCHSPGGWQEGRSVDTSGNMLNVKDRQGIQCDFCHRMVDYDYQAGTSPIEDAAVLAGIDPLPLQYGNGQFINDAAPLRRGPFADAQASHAFVESPLHRRADVCGTCHDVSNPVFVQSAPGDYTPTAFDARHVDMDSRNMFPVERTFSEWSQSEYATTGVYAPQFAGNKLDGIVSTCQDCHMPDVDAKGCNEAGSPRRPNLPLHDFMGGNTFIPDVIPDFFAAEVDVGALQAAKVRAAGMLAKAAALAATPEEFGLSVRVTNETGHKLPSGYPEGRRIWLHVRAIDASGATVFESGAYDAVTAELAHDSQLKVYEIEPGLSPGLAAALGLPAGPSFHFVLNDTVYADNRIPPRGFSNAAFAAIQSPPVAHAYQDGQYWDDTPYFLPAAADSAFVTLYYQTLSKEYVEFLRDANVTNSAGQDLYAAWVAHGKSAPVPMASIAVDVNVIPSSTSSLPHVFQLSGATPNPFVDNTYIAFSMGQGSHVRLTVHDVRGRLVRTLVDRVETPGHHRVMWNGRDDRGGAVAAGIYFVSYRAGTHAFVERAIVMR
jgi:hypothetical protein